DRGGRPVNAPLFLHVGRESPPLLGRVAQLVERVRQFDAATVEFEALGDPRIIRTDARERGLACRVGMKDSGSTDSQIWLDPLTEEPAEDVRPVIVRRDPETQIPRLGSERFRVGTAANR